MTVRVYDDALRARIAPSAVLAQAARDSLAEFPHVAGALRRSEAIAVAIRSAQLARREA